MIDRRGLLLGAAASAAAASAAPRIAFGAQFGSFEGEFVGRFLGGGRAVVEQPLLFIDPGGKPWTAPSGTEVNGASIPRALWTIVGSPFAGDYLRASVIHDHYCVTMERGWRETHRAFWYGCRADGLSRVYSNLLYGGVMRFGPRWKRRRGLTGASAKPRRIEPEFNQQEFDELRELIEGGDWDVDSLERELG